QEWHHIAFVWNQDGANPDQVIGYFNGVEAFNGTLADGYVSSLSDARIGRSFYNNLDGQMDEVRIWSTQRTVGEINASMNTALLGTESGLVAYYTFDNTTVAALGNNSAIGTRNDVDDKTGNFDATASGFDMGATPLSYNFRNSSNWVYSGAIAADIFVQDDLLVDLYHGSTHEFGNQGITDPTPLSRTYTITNHGNGMLTLGASAISLSIGSDFSISAQNGLTSLTAGQSTTFTIDFAPSTTGAKADNINITSDDPDEPTISIAVNGIGVQGPAGVADGIVTWLRNDEATAATWTDFSGNTEHFNPPLVGDQPVLSNTAIGFQSGLVFDGTDYMQSTNNSLIGGGAYTKIAVIISSASGSTESVISSDGSGNHEFVVSQPLGFPALIHNSTTQLTSSTDYTGVPLIMTGQYDGATNAELFVRGISEASNSSAIAYTDAGRTQIGARNGAADMIGTIAEVVIYDRVLTPTERQEIESYLSAKYGISYGQDVVSSGSGSTVWSFASGYSNDVVTIGRDDASFLDTRQVSSESSDIRFEIGHTSIEVDNATNVALGATSQFAADNAFISLGHNGAASNYAGRLSTNMPVGVTERMARTWLVNEPNTDITDVDLTIDMAGLNDWIGVTVGDYVLMIDDDGADWSNATIVGPSDYTSGSITFEGIDFDNGQFVSIGHGIDRALDFAGTDDAVSASDNVAYDVTDVTVEGWFYFNDVSGTKYLVSRSNFSASADGDYSLSVQGGSARFSIFTSSGWQHLFGTSTIGTGEWYHFAGVKNGTAIELYVNGVLEGSLTYAGTFGTNSNNPIEVGSLGAGTGSTAFFVGKMDEVRIWNDARTPTEIRQNAIAPTSTLLPDASMIAGYDFNSGSVGQDNSGVLTLTDLSAIGNNGTLATGPGFTLTGTTSNWVLSDYLGSGPATTPSIRVYDADGDIISDNATDSPSATNNTDFGTVITAGANTSAFTYTIQNTGFVAANIAGDVLFGGADYSRDADITGGLAVGASDDVTITFDPSVSGVRGSSISFATNGIGDGTYDFNVTGIGSASSSDIVVNGGFTPATGLDYNGQMAANIDREGAGTDGVEVAQFILRDGGGSDDGDGLATLLDGLTVQFTNEATIQKVALYKDLAGTPIEVAEVAIVGTDAVFSGLAALPGAQQIITGSAGNQTTIFSVVVTFANTTGVVDNTTDIDVTVVGASTASDVSGSGMNTGAADASLTANNTLDVTADRLIFTNGPSADVATGTNFNVTVQAHDASGNLDLNETTSVTVAEISAIGGTLTGGGATAMTSGSHTFTLNYDQPGSLNIDAQGTGLTTANYNTDQGVNINIVDVDNSSVIIASATLDESGVSLNPALVISEGTAQAVFDFDYVEDNGAGTDNFNTVISQIVFQEGAGVTLDENLDDIIAGVALSDGITTITSDNPGGATITIGTSSITFANIPTNGLALMGDILDNQTKTYTLSVWFRTDLAANGYSVDEEAFEFEVSTADFTFPSGSSTIAAAQNVNSGNVNIDVVASDVVITSFGGATDAESTNVNIQVVLNTAFAVTVEAQDAYGNLDLDYDNVDTPGHTIDVTSPGANITGTNLLNNPFANGVATWSDLTITAVGNYTFTVTDDISVGSGDFVSSTVAFDVSDAQSDIIEDSGFDYPEYIDYTQYDASDINGAGDDELHIATFVVRDGGVAANDTDVTITKLSDITFAVTNWENLDRMAIYNAGSAGEKQEVAVTSGTVFFDNVEAGGGDIDAPDDGTTTFDVWATFKQDNSIDDNEVITLTITGASANTGGGKSDFALNNAGGASTSNYTNSGDNEIEVKAYGFTQVVTLANPMTNSTTFERDPGFSIELEARDANGNIDLDVNGEVILTLPAGAPITPIASHFSSGTLVQGPIVIDDVFPSGTVTIDNLPLDTDIDGIPDVVDVDITLGLDVSPANGIDDRFEVVNTGGSDGDGDGIDDFYDPDITQLDFTAVTIQDTTTPTDITLTPAHLESAAVAVTELEITFSENVKAVGGNLILRDFNTLDVIETISVTNLSKTTIAGNVVTFTLSTILNKNTTYFVTVPANSFEDYGSNGWAGLIGAGSWSFTTDDATNPTMAFSAPADGATNVSRSSSIILTFDEPVNSNGGTITLVSTPPGYNESYIVGTDSEITGMGTNEIVINPSVNFSS
ncbi:MAG: LamG-like jellyroll fold domain-containing protein, partial [Reichenbachiella sp.]